MRGWAFACVVLIQLGLASGVLADPRTPLEADRVRIRAHLARVERHLRSTEPANLRPEARQARRDAIETLHAYWVAGEFPHNTRHPGALRPYFIDDEGRACAVAHLIIESGSAALAREVDERFHNAYVREMTDARVLAWADAHGFTVDELAMIQPSYCGCDAEGLDDGGSVPDRREFAPVCGGNGITYWNRCAAELCGGITVVHEGECAYDFTICRTCRFGTDAPVVDQCGEGVSYGVCGDDTEARRASSDVAARAWLAFQKQGCNPTDSGFYGPGACPLPDPSALDASVGNPAPEPMPEPMQDASTEERPGEAGPQADSGTCSASASSTPSPAWTLLVLAFALQRARSRRRSAGVTRPGSCGVQFRPHRAR